MDTLRHLFVAPVTELRPRWKEAFPSARLSDLTAVTPDADVIWILLPENGDISRLLAACRLSAGKRPIVAISDLPDEEQGMLALREGVSGYCNAQAAPEILIQVANTVTSGGVWIGQWLMGRLLSGITRATAGKFSQPEIPAWTLALTGREIEVARAVASGMGNKEIANQINITERTVKAHIGSVFKKLTLRDRMHLTLLVNGVVKS